MTPRKNRAQTTQQPMCVLQPYRKVGTAPSTTTAPEQGDSELTAKAREVVASLPSHSKASQAAAFQTLRSLVDGGPRLFSRDEQEDAYRWLMKNDAMLIDRMALVKFRADGQDFDRTPGGRVKDLRWCATELGCEVVRLLGGAA